MEIISEMKWLIFISPKMDLGVSILIFQHKNLIYSFQFNGSGLLMVELEVVVDIMMDITHIILSQQEMIKLLFLKII